MSQVSDYNIANASGASVRSDLNAVFDAIKTLNSGGSDPSNTEAFMPYVDTADNNNLKIRNAANNGFTTVGSVDSANLGLLPRAGGTMTGALTLSTGAVGTPSLTVGDSTTGLYRRGSNQLGVTVSGTQTAFFNSDGLSILGQDDLRLYRNSNDRYVALQASNSISGSYTLTLPTADGSNGQMLQTNGSGSLSFTTVAGVPRGSVFCIAHTSVPSGYVECNGASIPNGTGTVNGVTANFAPLRALIGANLPDLRGEFIRGYDNGRGVDSGRNMLEAQSSQFEQHNHSATSTSSVNDPGHKHTMNFNLGNIISSGGAFGMKDSGTADRMNTATTGISVATLTNIGNTGGSETRPRSIAMMYIIKF
jgi:hypothetical protein